MTDNKFTQQLEALIIIGKALGKSAATLADYNDPVAQEMCMSISLAMQGSCLTEIAKHEAEETT